MQGPFGRSEFSRPETIAWFLADGQPQVRRISGVLPDLSSELWIVTHEDLRHTARIRAFLGVVGDAIVAERRSFEGQSRSGL